MTCSRVRPALRLDRCKAACVGCSIRLGRVEVRVAVLRAGCTAKREQKQKRFIKAGISARRAEKYLT